MKVSQAASPREGAHRTRDGRYKWRALLSVSIGIYMAVLDGSIVSIALPAMADTYGVSLGSVQWVVLAYLMATSVFLLPLGFVADRAGRKLVYNIGFAVFVLGSMLSGIAPSIVAITLARVVQAAGAASLSANGMAIATGAFPANERGRAMGIIGTVVALGAITGPTVGGLIVDSFGWRWIFFINAPIGALGLFLGTVIIREDQSRAEGAPAKRSFDWLGMALSSGSLICGMLALTQGRMWGWGSLPTLGLLAASAVMFVGFSLAERRPDPMLPLAIFRRWPFSAGLLSSFLVFTALSANGLLIPFYLQRVMGYSARTAGLLMLPFPIAMAVAGIICGRLSDKLPARLIASLGLLASMVGVLNLAFLDQSSGIWRVAVWQAVTGAGMGAFGPPNNNAVFSAVPRAIYGVAAASTNLSRNLGQTAGVAVAALAVEMTMLSAGYPAQFSSAAASPGSIAAFIIGMRTAFLLAAGVTLIAMVISLARGTAREPEPPVLAEAARPKARTPV